jgi:hypothetical protein
VERETLLPCPFCGDDGDKGRQEVTQMIEGRNKFARITCRACGAMCPEENWNRRAALAAQRAEPDMRHPKIQALIGKNARQHIWMMLVEQLVEDPNFETTAMDMEHWDTLHDKLKEKLTAAPAAVPPGYALVPIEPTPEMLDAGDVARHSVVTQARTSVIYRAMIAAAGDKV